MSNTMPKIAIGVPTLFPFVSKYFWLSYEQLDKKGCMLISTTGTITAVARNKIVDQAIKDNCTHVLFLDADMTFPKDTIQRLLKHDVSIVGGLYYVRDNTKRTCVYYKDMEPTKRIPKGLSECDGVGTGCMLVKIEVFKAMEFPWFEYNMYDKENKKFNTEDTYFCMKAQDYGFMVWIDTDIQCGHVIEDILGGEK